MAAAIASATGYRQGGTVDRTALARKTTTFPEIQGPTGYFKTISCVRSVAKAVWNGVQAERNRERRRIPSRRYVTGITL